MEKIWKTIDEFPNYQISNFGEVYSIKNKNIIIPRIKKEESLLGSLKIIKNTKNIYIGYLQKHLYQIQKIKIK